jgi:hypothetical protein
MESIGQLTVDDSGSLANPHEFCEQLGFTPGEKLVVERLPNGEASLKPLAQQLNGDVTISDIEAAEMKLVSQDGVMVFMLEGDAPLPDAAREWLLDPVKHDRESRMRELMRGCGLEGFD